MNKSCQQRFSWCNFCKGQSMESGQFFSDFQETFHEVPKPTESDRPIRCFVDVSILTVGCWGRGDWGKDANLWVVRK